MGAGARRSRTKTHARGGSFSRRPAPLRARYAPDARAGGPGAPKKKPLRRGSPERRGVFTRTTDLSDNALGGPNVVVLLGELGDDRLHGEEDAGDRRCVL